MCNVHVVPAGGKSFFGIQVTSLSEEIQQQKPVGKSDCSHDDTRISPPSSAYKSIAPTKRRRAQYDVETNSNKHSIIRRANMRAMELVALAEQEKQHQHQHQGQREREQEQEQEPCTAAGRVRFAPTVVTQLWEPEATSFTEADLTNLFYSESEIRQFRMDAIKAEHRAAEAKQKEKEITEDFVVDPFDGEYDEFLTLRPKTNCTTNRMVRASRAA